MVVGVGVSEELNDRLKEARHRSGLTQEQVAERLQVEPLTVSFWEQGVRKPGRDNLVGLATLFGVSVDYLLGLADEEPRRPMTKMLRDLTDRFEMLELVEVPILGVVPAGDPMIPIEMAGEYIEVPAHLTHGVRQPFALRIAGDSLSDMGIHDGQVVVVDPDADVIDGKVYVVQMDGLVTAKRIYREGDTLRLEGAQGAVVISPPAQVETLGRVVGVGSWTEL